MNIRWILSNLGTAPATGVDSCEDYIVIDVRDLVDKPGNVLDAVSAKIEIGLKALRSGRSVVVACDYGISRSNAIAAGILASYESRSIDNAIRFVIEKTGEQEIKLELLDIVRTVLNSDKSKSTENLDQKTIMVTGGTGFLGKPLLQKLSELNLPVYAPDKETLDIFGARAELDMVVRERNVGCIVHLANPRIYTSNQAMGSTLVMLRNILESCSYNAVRLLYTSSWEVYSGYRSSYLLADECLPCFPRGPYGETKWLCERLINHFRQTMDLQSTILRFCPIYGGGSAQPKFIHNFAKKAVQREPIVTHRYRNGPAALDLLHRDDAVRALALAASHKYTGDLNIGTGVLTPTKQVASWFAEWCGSSSEVTDVPVDSDLAGIAMDFSNAKEAIDWEPSIPVQDGLHSFFLDFLERQETEIR